MLGRPLGWFRGSEFPRLLLLLAIVAIGWPLAWSRLGSRAQPPAPPTLGAPPSRVEPDRGPIFAAIRDRTHIGLADNAAYRELLARARRTAPAELARHSRRDLMFTHLWENPDRYRGVPVHLEGTALKSLSYEVGPELAPGGRLYEAWVVTPDSQKYPYVLVFEDPPDRFPAGPGISERVTFDGYFLKLLAYEAGDKPRAAPMLVGRLRWTPFRPGGAEDPGRSTLRWLFAGMGALTVFSFIRWGLYLRSRRVRATGRRPSRNLSTTDTIEPEALADWIERPPDDDDSPSTA